MQGILYFLYGNPYNAENSQSLYQSERGYLFELNDLQFMPRECDCIGEMFQLNYVISDSFSF